jgi:hypothetical protein
MKDAMWKIDPVQGISFRDSATVDHPVLFEQKPDLSRLEALLRDHFGAVEFSIEAAVDYTLMDTPFRDNGQLKPMLKAAEAGDRLKVTRAKDKRRPGQFPPGAWMQFL